MYIFQKESPSIWSFILRERDGSFPPNRGRGGGGAGEGVTRKEDGFHIWSFTKGDVDVINAREEARCKIFHYPVAHRNPPTTTSKPQR